MKGYSNGSPVTASYSSRCCSSSCDGGRDVQLVTAPPRPPGGHKMVHVCGRKKMGFSGRSIDKFAGLSDACINERYRSSILTLDHTKMKQRRRVRCFLACQIMLPLELEAASSLSALSLISCQQFATAFPCLLIQVECLRGTGTVDTPISYTLCWNWVAKVIHTTALTSAHVSPRRSVQCRWW